MIKGLQGNIGITVSGGNTSIPYVGPNASNPMTGMLRINGTEMEVFNGNSWQILSTSYATVGLDQETQDLLQWARKQRSEELQFQALLNQHHHPAVRLAQKNLEEAMESVKIAKEQLKITAHLSRDYETAN